MTEPLRRVLRADLTPIAGDGRLPVAVFIEPMSEEQVALLAEDLVDTLSRRARRQHSEVASEPP